MGPAAGPVGATHGLVPALQTCPSAASPFGTPSTDHVTVPSDVFDTVAANVMRWPVKTPALDGATDTVTLLVIVIVADSVVEPPSVTELAVAWIVTGFPAGIAFGAVYRALSGPVAASVPRLEFPFVTPFTSHVTVAPDPRQNDPLNACCWPSATFADDGEIEFVAVHVIVTLALPEAEASAVLVAVTVTDAGEGTAAGAV